jgi:putative DNA primase/helicase
MAQHLTVPDSPGPDDDRRPLTEAELASAQDALDEVTAQVAGQSDLTEDGLATGFARTRDNHRYVAAWTWWMRWTGKHWERDTTLALFSDVREFIRWRALNDNDSEKAGKELRRAQTVAAVERLLRSERAYAATPEQWDAEPWILNTPGGIVDLKTGAMRPAQPSDYCTKSTAVAPGGECPRWQKFLTDVTAGDSELIGFLQRLFGYALSGSVREHSLAFVYGPGGNGKGVLLNTLVGIWHDYAAAAPAETFMEARGERHPTELAGLKGHRLVVAQEVDEGRRWNESRLKSITGGDPIQARFMRGDFFTFSPQFKLVIAGNHRPRLNSVDEAIRRRLFLIPFDVVIPASRRDPDLAEKLRAEWPGILAWCIAGCLDYLDRGLAAPDRVRAATDSYFSAQDLFADWLDDRAETGADYWATPRSLFESWTSFMEAAGERPGRQREFIEKLEAHGFAPGRENARGRFWRGLRLKMGSGQDAGDPWP